MPMPPSRNPRTDPQVGDILLVKRTVRTVYGMLQDGSVLWATETPINSGHSTIDAWKRWAADAEVLRVSK